MISFKTTKEEGRLIAAIVERASAGGYCDRLALTMDITAVHANGMPLRLQEWLDAPDFDFAHDIAGIVRHIDRETGVLGNCFVPRFAVRQARSTVVEE